MTERFENREPGTADIADAANRRLRDAEDEGRRIEREEFIRGFAIALSCLALELRRGNRRQWTRASLVCIGADERRHIVLFALREDLVDSPRKCVAIHDDAEAKVAAVAIAGRGGRRSRHGADKFLPRLCAKIR